MVRRRPLVWLALAWMAGVLLGGELGTKGSVVALWLSALLLIAGTIALHRVRHLHWPALLLLVAVGLGALAFQATRLPVERLYPLLEDLERVHGLVVSYPSHRGDRSAFVLRPDGLPGALQIFYYHPGRSYFPVRYGDALEIEAEFQIPWQFADFDYRQYLQTRNIWGVGTLWSGRQIDRVDQEQGHPLLQWGYRTRLRLFELIDHYVPPPGNGLLKGLLFGERAYLSEDVEQGFRDAGVMHVLAVSGLHVGILLGLFWGLLRLLGLSFTQIYIALLPPLVGYLAVVGFKVSLVRASLMFAFVALGWVIAERGWILKKWIDPLQGLSAAALVILTATPWALFDVSFQLSFAATAGILLTLTFALSHIEEWKARWWAEWEIHKSPSKRVAFKLGEVLAFFLVITTAAQLAVAPVLAYHFHRVYLGALVANLAVVPLATIALWLGVFLIFVAGLALGPFAAVLGALEGWVLSRLIDITLFFAHLPGAYLVVDRGMQLAALVALPLILSLPALRALQLAFPKLWSGYGRTANLEGE